MEREDVAAMCSWRALLMDDAQRRAAIGRVRSRACLDSDAVGRESRHENERLPRGHHEWFGRRPLTRTLRVLDELQSLAPLHVAREVVERR
jgi:hypothetical protein